MSGLFIAGTDTGCGKTSVACALARTLRRAGLRVRALKPVETGCDAGADGERIPADALALAEACGDPAPLERLCPYRLALPAAPIVAAGAESVAIELPRIRKAYREAKSAADLVIVEGAGGLLVPIADDFGMADLAAQLDLPLLLVARASLGTINHTLLTLEAAAARSLRVLGLVVSHAAPELGSAERANLDHLLAHLPVPCLAELRHGAPEWSPLPDASALLAQVRAS